MGFRCLLALASLLVVSLARGEGLNQARLGVLYNLGDTSSQQVAFYYAAQRHIPPENIVGLHLPNMAILAPEVFGPMRIQALNRLPSSIQSLVLVWSKPYAVGCMSITSAFAAGYRPEFCQPGCSRTPLNPLFNAEGWLPADTVGWWPAMMLPSGNPELARALIQRGIAADTAAQPGTLYLVRTADKPRNVRAATYAAVENALTSRVRVTELTTPISSQIPNAIGYFSGAAHVDELTRIHFLPGALADHLTSSGGVLEGGDQMSAAAWLKQGATASYGSVSEPCNFLDKFPNVNVLFDHYTHGETALEAYWKSVVMPGQGLFIGDPLSRPFAAHR